LGIELDPYLLARGYQALSMMAAASQMLWRDSITLMSPISVNGGSNSNLNGIAFGMSAKTGMSLSPVLVELSKSIGRFVL
jgi:hypothetical protein